LSGTWGKFRIRGMVAFQNGIGDIPPKALGMDTGIYQKGQEIIIVKKIKPKLLIKPNL
jgi:hypothetical protein